MSRLRVVPTVASALVVLALFAPGHAQAQGAGPPQENTTRPENLQAGDAFGEEVTLTEQTIVYFSGSGQWDNAFETIVDGFKTVTAYLQKQGIKPAGPLMTIYTS